jgi:divalent metal cation (Fe/Co/Zn/Cd) transporter
MDTSDPELLEEICRVIAEHRRDMWIDIHQLRARRAGAHIFMDFHLILPRELTLEESHREVKQMEKILSDHYAGQADILIHADPCMDPECPICGHEPCDYRHEGAKMRRLWRRDTLTCNGPHKTSGQSEGPEK